MHCARWQTSKGIECHCDLTDRYLSYLDVMDVDNDCCRWEKETKWDLEKEHDEQIRADEREKVLQAVIDCGWHCEIHSDKALNEMVAEQLKGNK